MYIYTSILVLILFLNLLCSEVIFTKNIIKKEYYEQERILDVYQVQFKNNFSEQDKFSKSKSFFSFISDYLGLNYHIEGFAILTSEFYKYFISNEYPNGKLISADKNSLINFNRLLQNKNTSSDNNSLKTTRNFLISSTDCGLGKSIVLNHTFLNCSQESNYTICQEDSELIDACICPTTYNDCEHITNDVVCKFQDLHGNDIDLLNNADSLYFEYFKKNVLKNNHKNKFSFEAKIKCRNRHILNFTKNYIIRGYENVDMTDYKIVNESLIEPFKYFLNHENLTIFYQPNVTISITFYDLKSITPALRFSFLVHGNYTTDVLKGIQQ
jgi:hypothetical protein